MNQALRVLLTGGTGFLGSHVAELLVRRGHAVRATVRGTSDTRWLDPLPVDRVEADLSDPRALDRALAGVSAVVHVGGLTRSRDPREYERVNAAGTASLAAAAGSAGVGRFVYVSSLAARGPDGASGPESPYGLSKFEGERRLADLAADGLTPPQIRILRPGGIYGPRDSDLLSLFRMASRGLLVLPASEGRLQPVHVADAADAVVRALESAGPNAGPLAIAGPETSTWEAVADAIVAAMDRRIRVLRLPSAVFTVGGAAAEFGARFLGRPPAFDRRRARDLTAVTWTADIDPARRALDWEPRVDLRSGLADTAAWYREHGWIVA